MKSRVSLFIPVYNAAKYVRQAVEQSYLALSELGIEFEIVIVDDNSNDKSYRFKPFLSKIRQEPGRSIRYIFHANGPSRRENLAKAFEQAQYDILCFIDVDLSCDITFLTKALNLIMQHPVDIVIGSRYIKGAKVKRQLFRRVMSFFYNTTIRLMFRSKILDHQCGLKVFRKEAAMAIIASMGYDHHFVRGWFWDAEFLIRSQKSGLKIIEMPVEWHYARTSTFNFLREWKCIAAMIELKSDLDRESASPAPQVDPQYENRS
ncbi:MAG: glycosyltransferase [Candidatus Omnitrophica bacterium]|nr:glycosyltransferase [Candidatus Omnitrophota bacterium]